MTRESPSRLRPAHKPLFLLTALWATVGVPLWLAVRTGLLAPPPTMPLALWHAHEMIFGFAGAAMAGFLVARAERRALVLLAGSWLLARLAPWMEATPAPVLLLPFPALLVYGVSPAFVADPKRPVNLVFGLVPVALLVLEGVVALGLLRDEPERVAGAVRSGLALVALLLATMGGRLLRAATAGVVQRAGRPFRAPLGTGLELTVVALLTLALFALFDEATRPAAGAALLFAGAFVLLRLWRWRAREAWTVAEVRGLHLGYLWLGLGLLLWGASELGAGPPPADAVHLFTVGALGTLVFTVIARTACQRGGLGFAAARPVVRFAPLLALAALLRLLVPASGPLATAALAAATLAWSLAFGLLLVRVARWPAGREPPP